MPTRDSYLQGVPCWADLGTPDVSGAKTFYGALFDWEFQDVPTDTTPYSMAYRRGLPAAGLGPLPSDGHPTVWTTYLAVDDADRSAAAVDASGGRVLQGPFDVMETGRMAICSDPGGAVFGIWQGRDHFGAGVVNEHGSLNWNELLTDAVESSLEFYASALGLTSRESKNAMGADYWLLTAEDRAVAGVMAKPVPEMPNFWDIYFAVDDIDQAIGKAEGNGGAKAFGPMEIPEIGSFSGLTDPFGAHFTVIQLVGEVD